MGTRHRKSFAAFAFVLFVSAPTQGSSPVVVEAVGACLRAVLPQASGPSQVGVSLPNEVLLAPRTEGSYGWSTGQLLHPDQRTCLARVMRSSQGVAFRACDVNDRTQRWQWKAHQVAQEGGTLSVLQHQFTGQVLERVRAKQGDAFGLADYRVGADTQRFSVRECNS
ncbi:MAG: hypothetical protein V4739_13035 [Pseudomonadota bacterium]